MLVANKNRKYGVYALANGAYYRATMILLVRYLYGTYPQNNLGLSTDDGKRGTS
jgi:hypothetical protein